VIPHAAQDVAAALRRKVIESRARQGLPPTITDPATVERIASIMRLVVLPDAARPSSRTPPPTKSGRRSTSKTGSASREDLPRAVIADLSEIG
jgi:hypothetical protein